MRSILKCMTRVGSFILVCFFVTSGFAQNFGPDSSEVYLNYKNYYVNCTDTLFGHSSSDNWCQNVTLYKPKKNVAYFLRYRPHKVEPKSFQFQLQADIRKSFIQDLPIDIYGINVGGKINSRFRVGLGFYFFIKTYSDEELGLNTKNGAPITDSKGYPHTITYLNSRHIKYIAATQKLNVYFGTINFAYSFYNSKLLELSVPLEIGYGYFQEEISDPSGNNFSSLPKIPTSTKGNFMPFQFGLKTTLKVHRWSYLFSSVGYRTTLFQVYTSESRYTNFNEQFNGFYYQFGVTIQTRTIIEDVFKKGTKIRFW